MNNNAKVKVYVPVGVPGSGKSTLAKYIAATEEKNLAVFSSDKTRQRLFDEGIIKMAWDDSTNQIVFKQLYKDINSEIEHGGNVFLDATNINVFIRKRIFENLPKDKCQFIACVLETNKEKCLERVAVRESSADCDHYLGDEHDLVIGKYIAQFEMPMQEEGFSEIRVYDMNKQNQIFTYLKESSKQPEDILHNGGNI